MNKETPPQIDSEELEIFRVARARIFRAVEAQLKKVGVPLNWDERPQSEIIVYIKLLLNKMIPQYTELLPAEYTPQVDVLMAELIHKCVDRALKESLVQIDKQMNDLVEEKSIICQASKLSKE